MGSLAGGFPLEQRQQHTHRSGCITVMGPRPFPPSLCPPPLRMQRFVPTVEEERIYVEMAHQDAGLARRLGSFVLAAVELLTDKLGLLGGWGWTGWVAGVCERLILCWVTGYARQTACFACQPAMQHNTSIIRSSGRTCLDLTARCQLCRESTAALPAATSVTAEWANCTCTVCTQHECVSCVAGIAPLPSEVKGMLAEGRWCSTAVRWTIGVAEELQRRAAAEVAGAAVPPPGAEPSSSSRAAAAGSSGHHDALSALVLVRAAVAALALVSDVGFEAAVRHISQEYYSLAARVRGFWLGGWRRVVGV